MNETTVQVITPDLDVIDLQVSIRFYAVTLGFAMAWGLATETRSSLPTDLWGYAVAGLVQLM